MVDNPPLLGVDVGGTHVKWAHVAGGAVVESGQVDTPRDGGAALVRLVGELARDLVPGARSVGLAVPGLVDVPRRRTLFIPNIPGEWEDLALGDAVESVAGRPVALLNDARAFAHGELLAGAGRGRRDVAFVTLGTGVGGAIARDGAVLLGETDALGEIGHVTVRPGGERCGCGARGCLETVASGSALVGFAARAVLTSLSPRLAALTDGSLDRLTPRVLAEAAALGDAWALEAFERAGRAIGVAAGSACVLLRLTTVVVGGGLSPAFPYLAPALREQLAERSTLVGPIEVLQAELGPIAGAVGAALYGGIARRKQFPDDLD